MKKLFFTSVVCLLVTTAFSQEQDSMKTVNLESIVISAFRVKSEMSDLPNKVQILQKSDIESVPSEDVAALLKKTACFDIVQYPGFKANIGLRGFSPTAHGQTYTMLLLNGIPVGTQNVATIDLGNVEQIEVLKGPFSSFYGSGAMAGVVNIVTPASKGEIRGRVGTSLGSFQTYKVFGNVGGSLDDHLNFDLNLKYLSQNQPYKTGNHNFLNMDETEELILEGTYGKDYENTGYDRYGAGLRIGYDLNEDWEIHLYENYSLADNVYTNGNFWGSYGSSEKDILRWSHSINVEGKERNHTIRFSPWFTQERENYYSDLSSDSYLTTQNKNKSYGFILQDAIQVGAHSFVIGIDNHSQKYLSERWNSEDQQGVPYQPDYSNIQSGVYAQANINLFNNRLNATLGGRADNIGFKVYETENLDTENASDNYFTFNPNLGLQFKILEDLRLQGSIGTAFLAPDAFKKTGYYITNYGTYVGNPELDPETSRTYDLGFVYRNKRLGVLIDFAYFNTKLKGLIDNYMLNDEDISYRNANDSQMNGLELSLAYDFGAHADYKYSLKVYGNITHLLKSEVTIDEVTDDMKYVRNNNASIGVEYIGSNGLAARINSRYIGSRFEDNWFSYGEIRPELQGNSILRHPDYMVFDFSAGYTIAGRYKIGLEVENLLDENYTEKDGYNMPGRAFMGTFTYLF